MDVKEQLKLNNQELQKHYDFIPTMPTADEAKNGQYTWHKYSVIDGKKGKSIGFVVDDDETAYPMDGIHTDGFYYVIFGMPLKIVTWAEGTDAEIVNMIKAADSGLINLQDYWAIGQERRITLSAMSKGAVGESHIKQTVIFVLMNAGGKILSNGKECSFIVGMKNCLSKNGEEEPGYMNSWSSNTGGWKECARRTWCNSTFRNAIPSTIRPIFKQFKNMSGLGGGSDSGVEETLDYFALPAEIEIFNKTIYSVTGEG